MTDQYYLDMNGATAGPFTLAQVSELYLAGTVNDETIYSQPQSVEWLPLKTIAPLLKSASAPAAAKPTARRKDYLCTACGTIGRPVPGPVKGSLLVEILLYFFFCFPGFIYTAWRNFGRGQVCPACKCATVIPVTSPAARDRVTIK